MLPIYFLQIVFSNSFQLTKLVTISNDYNHNFYVYLFLYKNLNNDFQLCSFMNIYIEYNTLVSSTYCS